MKLIKIIPLILLCSACSPNCFGGDTNAMPHRCGVIQLTLPLPPV